MNPSETDFSGKEGKDATEDGTPMEEELTEVADLTTKQRAKYVLAYFVSDSDKPGQTANQKGQRIKGKVNDEIEGYEITRPSRCRSTPQARRSASGP